MILAREAEEEQKENDSELPPCLPGKNGLSTDASEDDEEIVAAWTLRKCSAAGLDKLSTLFGDELLQYVLPVIQEKIQSPLWKERESAVLVFGAISDGCDSGLELQIQIHWCA